MKYTRLNWKLLLGLLGAGLMSVSAYGQTYNNASYVMPSRTPTVAPMMTSPTMAPMVYQDATGGCDSGCGAPTQFASACGGGCDAPAGASCGSRCSGDPKTLFGGNCDDPWMTIGGWIQAGFHSDSNGLFNNQPSDFNVHQAWLFAERVAESKDGGIGLGFRFDGMYGIDAADTQAFGNPGATWDLAPGFQRNGGFGWAIPQLYGEVAMGDVSVKIGHFYTLVGYEVVTAPDNFFYSHAMTMYNSEPFTHTGVLASWAMNENTTVYGGWTAGWDSGFDFSAGSNFLGGFSTQLDPDVTLTYIATLGNFGIRSGNNDDGYSHSIVLDMNMSENWNTVVQSDMTRIESTGEDSVGLMLFNFYTLNDCLSFGTRTEWWKGDDIIGYNYGGLAAAPTGSTSYVSQTAGFNYRINPNIILRPEYRFDHSPGLDYDEGYFGMDVIATF